MTEPLIGIGHGLELADLVPFIIEPAISEGVANAQRDFSGDGTIHERGSHCVLLWPVIDGVEDLTALLAQIGLDDDADLRTAVTAYLPTKRRNWHLYNAWALMPQTLNYAFWPQNLRVMLNGVVQIG
jgi:hypothetical protein